MFLIISTPFLCAMRTLTWTWIFGRSAMVYTCQFCGLNFDGSKDIRNHLTKGCKGQVDDSSLLDAAERYQAKKRRIQEERAAKRRRLMMPMSFPETQDANEAVGDWYDIPETQHGETVSSYLDSFVVFVLILVYRGLIAWTISFQQPHLFHR